MTNAATYIQTETTTHTTMTTCARCGAALETTDDMSRWKYDGREWRHKCRRWRVVWRGEGRES